MGRDNTYVHKWFSHKSNGFRRNYVFLSAPVAEPLLSAEHLHKPRELKIPDNSALKVTVRG
jgi:hypothetical protein